MGCYVVAVSRQSPEYVPPINAVVMHEYRSVARKLVMTASLETSLHMRMLSQQHLRTGSLG